MALTFGLFVFAVRFHHTSNSMSMCVLFCFFFASLLTFNICYVVLDLFWKNFRKVYYTRNVGSVRFVFLFLFFSALRCAWLHTCGSCFVCVRLSIVVACCFSRFSYKAITEAAAVAAVTAPTCKKIHKPMKKKTITKTPIQTCERRARVFSITIRCNSIEPPQIANTVPPPILQKYTKHSRILWIFWVFFFFNSHFALALLNLLLIGHSFSILCAFGV